MRQDESSNAIYEERARAVWAQNSPATNSKRWSQYVDGVSPKFVVKGQDCYVWDQDGRKYIDFVCGLGAISLGYNHPKVTEAAIRHLKNGVTSGSLPHTLEVEVAELICSIFKVEKVRFGRNGDDSTTGAIRIARAFNERPGIASDGYHGRSDLWVSMTPPAYGVKDQFRIHPSEAFTAKQPSEYDAAAYIFEGLTLRDDKEEVESIKAKIEFFKKTHAVVISDEIVTGCRVERWTANQTFGYEADLVCLGKGIANGFPLSVIAGPKNIMDHTEYFLSSTFGGESLSLAACKATLEEIQQKSLKDLVFYAKRFMSNLNAILKDINVEIKGYGTRGMFPATQIEGALFMQEAAKAGMLFGKAFFYNFSHMEIANLEETVMNLSLDIVKRIKRGDVKLEGKLPQESFKR